MGGMNVEYFDGKQRCVGYLASGSRGEPCILVLSAFRGLDSFAKEKADALASLGYNGFALDVYGEGRVTEDLDEAREWMAPFFLDRALLHRRVKAGLFAAREKVGGDRFGAIGFCFGGLCVYELLRSGAPVDGVVSFHGVFAPEREGKKAKLVPLASGIKGSLLILHGHEDPFVAKGDLEDVQREMTKAGVDWQIHTYGHTMHAFTNPMAHSPERGTVYNELACKRSWQAMESYFNLLWARG